jgi:hypothetical protein
VSTIPSLRRRRGLADKPTVEDIDKAPENLPVPVAAPDDPEIVMDLHARFSEIANENFGLKAENISLKGRLETKTAIDSLLGPYSNKVFTFLCFYGLVAFLLLLLNGFHLGGFNLDPSVLKFIVGSTAVSAIGLVGLVIRGMFGVANG